MEKGRVHTWSIARPRAPCRYRMEPGRSLRERPAEHPSRGCSRVTKVFGDSGSRPAGPPGSGSVIRSSVSAEPLEAPPWCSCSFRAGAQCGHGPPLCRRQHLACSSGRWHPSQVGIQGEGDHPLCPPASQSLQITSEAPRPPVCSRKPLPRVLRDTCTGALADGTTMP